MTTKAFIIDPFKKQVTATQIDGHRSIGGILMDLSNSIIMPTGRDILFVADSGLFVPSTKLFCTTFYHSPMAGKGVIAGFDIAAGEGGGFLDVSLPLRTLRKMISWPAYGVADLRVSISPSKRGPSHDAG